MGLIWIFITVGGMIGAYAPIALGAGATILLPIITGTVGSLAGIVLYKKLDL